MPRHTMLDELKWVHGMLRRDLQACRELAATAADGASAGDLRAGIESLQTGGPLFQLRVNCLQYCTFVHHHHALEDTSLFPAIRHARPDLASAVDRLEADHRLVSRMLGEIEAAAADLDSPAARGRLVDALTELAEHLTEHLDFEETALAPVLDGATR